MTKINYLVIKKNGINGGVFKIKMLKRKGNDSVVAYTFFFFCVLNGQLSITWEL